MRILLTNIVMNGRTGTETVTRDLALGLLRKGHRPMVYTQGLGEIGEVLRHSGVVVTDDIETLEGPVDVIHGHHSHPTAIAMARYPTTPAIFVCHDFTAWHDAPPKLPGIRAYAAVSQSNVERLAYECGAAPETIRLIRNGVDTERFALGPPLPERARRVLAFCRAGHMVQPIKRACDRADLQVDFVGYGVGAPTSHPELLMPEYDIVIGSGLTALEALSCGRAVVICDDRGLAGMLTQERYERWSAENLGLRTLTHRISEERLFEGLLSYDPGESAALSERVRSESSMARWVSAYEDLYQAALAAPAPAADRTVRALAGHLQRWGPRVDPRWPWMIERQQLIEDRERLFSGLEPPPLGEPLTFGTDGCAGEHVALSGFYDQEPDGAWSRTPTCGLRLRLPPGEDVVLEVDIRAVVLAGGTTTVDVFGNGAPLETWLFTPEEAGGVRRARAPAELADGDVFHLGLRTSLMLSPAEVSGTADTRKLGVRLQSLTVRTV